MPEQKSFPVTDAYESMFGSKAEESESLLPDILPLSLNKPLIHSVMENAKKQRKWVLAFVIGTKPCFYKFYGSIAAAGRAGIPNFVINLLYGSIYLDAASLLIWFGIFISFFTFDSLIISYQLSLGRSKVVVLPFIAAFIQIILIWFFHQTLFMVIFISIIVTALLLVTLLVYSSFRKINFYEHKFNIDNSSSL